MRICFPLREQRPMQYQSEIHPVCGCSGFAQSVFLHCILLAWPSKCLILILVIIYKLLLPSSIFKGIHSLLCIDGNFEHRRCKSAGPNDQALIEYLSYFVPENVVSEMRDNVAKLRRTWGTAHEDKDLVLPGLHLPNYVFESCGSCFTAADETKKKAESLLYANTGLMALTCHHNCVISMVNLHDAGEKQYNALALIRALFDELPSDWNLGLLYNIGCQLDKSIMKVGIS